MSNVARLLLIFLTFAIVGCRTGATQPDCNWNDAGGRSLIEDVKRADDLAIRHADARGPTAGWRAVREACEATLFSAVAQKHHVTMRDIADVRASLGKRSLDAAVHLPMLLITCALATRVTARLKRRFGDELLPYVTATAFWAVFCAALIVFIGHVWSAVLEVIRIGNGHLSYRAARIPWSHQWTQVFGGAVMIFAFASLVQGRNRFAPPASITGDLGS